jgi:DNA-binding transcriptional LysR family regulator
MELDLGCVGSFLVLAEEKHVGRAAHRLNLTPSALTKRIQKLEKQLDAFLLSRDASRIFALTAEGVRFASAAGPLLAHAEAARRTARAAPVDHFPVKFGVIGAIGEAPTRALLREMADRLRVDFPAASLVVREVQIGRLNEALHLKQVDVILTITTRDRHNDLTFSDVSTIDRVVLVSKHHPLAEAKAITATAVCSHPMLFDPAVPADWMDPFWLGDFRPSKDARRLAICAPNAATVFRRLASADCLMLTDGALTHQLIGGLRSLKLTEAPALPMLVARRSQDRREPVLALERAIKFIYADTSFQPLTAL